MGKHKQLTVKEYHDENGNGRPHKRLWLKGQTVSHIDKSNDFYRLQLSDGKTEVLREWELVITG